MSEEANTEYQQFDSISFLLNFFSPHNKQTHMETDILLKAIKELPERLTTVLNIGPIVHVELALRNRADYLFMSDYVGKNNNTVVNWICGKPDYSWEWMCAMLNCIGRTNETAEEMQRKTREKIGAVLEALELFIEQGQAFQIDVFQHPMIRSVYWQRKSGLKIPEKFQLVISTYCITNISATYSGFKTALKNAVDLVERGGYLVLAGNLKETSYKVGNQEFQHEPLELKHVLEALQDFGAPAFAVFTEHTLFTSVSKKLAELQ